MTRTKIISKTSKPGFTPQSASYAAKKRWSGQAGVEQAQAGLKKAMMAAMKRRLGR